MRTAHSVIMTRSVFFSAASELNNPIVISERLKEAPRCIKMAAKKKNFRGKKRNLMRDRKSRATHDELESLDMHMEQTYDNKSACPLQNCPDVVARIFHQLRAVVKKKTITRLIITWSAVTAAVDLASILHNE